MPTKKEKEAKESVETVPVQTREHGVIADGEVLPVEEQPLKEDLNTGRQIGSENLVGSDERADTTPVEVRAKTAEVKAERTDKHKEKEKNSGFKVGNTTYHV